MATEIKLPRLGQGMESGTIVKWLKSEGEPVEKGEPLYELDTDKVTQEVEADASGVLLKIAVQEGEVPVGQTIAVIGEEGEEVSVEAPQEDGAPQSAEKPAEAPKREPERERGREASAERAATAPAPAPAAAPAAAPAGEVEVEQLSSMRRTIARRLTEAWQAPVFQIAMTADMRRTLELRRKLVEQTPEDGVRPTVNDVLTKICAVALMRHRAVNALYRGDSVELHPTANVGIAVAIEKGLIVPVIASAERRTIPEIAAARAEVVGRARAGKLTQADLDGGTFTISNLGMYGVERFIAVLNPPQAAILAVGSVEERPAVEDGAID